MPTCRWAVAALALVALAVTAAHGIRRAGAADARAEIAQARADSLYSRAMAAESALDAVMTQESALIQIRTAERDSARARAARAERRRPEVVDRVVVAAGPDSAVVRAAVEEVVDSIEVHELAPLRAALVAADSVAAGLTRQRDAAVAANALLRGALEASRAEADAQEAARPSLLGFHVQPSTAFVAGAVTGLAAAGGVVVWAVLR